MTASYSFLGRFYSSADLKGLAILFMIIDHIGAILLPALNIPLQMYDGIYEILRIIGRLSYPLFVYLLIQGFRHSHNRLRYFSWIFITAIITEPFYDFAHSYAWADYHDQNVLFSLSLMLVLLKVFEKIEASNTKKTYAFFASFLAVVLTIIIGHYCNFEYGEVSPFYLLGLLYLDKNRYKPPAQLFGSMIGIIYVSLIVKAAIIHPYLLTSISGIKSILISSVGIQLYAALSVFFISAYDGTKGKRLPKLLYYAIYPIHLLILGTISYHL